MTCLRKEKQQQQQQLPQLSPLRPTAPEYLGKQQAKTVAGVAAPRGGGAKSHLPDHFRIVHYEILPPREVLF